GQAGEVDLGLVGAGKDVVRHHGVQQGDKVDGLVAGKQADHLGVDAAVLGGIEHLGPDDLHQVGQDLRIEQHRAQHALFGLHAVGRLDAHALQVQFTAAGAAAVFRHTSLPFNSSRKSAPFFAGSAAAAKGGLRLLDLHVDFKAGDHARVQPDLAVKDAGVPDVLDIQLDLFLVHGLAGRLGQGCGDLLAGHLAEQPAR